MRYADVEINVKGKGNFAGKLHAVTGSCPQVETVPEAEQFFGGSEGVIGALNSFLTSRAPSGFRSKVASFLKSATSWDAVVAFANEQVAGIRDYAYEERGASAKKIVDTIRSLDAATIESASAEELRAMLLALK
jgi:hypothetical protein